MNIYDASVCFGFELNNNKTNNNNNQRWKIKISNFQNILSFMLQIDALAIVWLSSFGHHVRSSMVNQLLVYVMHFWLAGWFLYGQTTLSQYAHTHTHTEAHTHTVGGNWWVEATGTRQSYYQHVK